MQKQFLFVVFFFCLSSHFSFAIGDDSTYHRYNPLWTNYFHPRFPDYIHSIDTSIDKFHEYDMLQQHFGWMNLGNNGTPAFQTIYHSMNNSELQWGLEQSVSPYLKSPENIRFYKTLKPYSHLYYVMGSKSEQQLVGTHTQNIGRNANVGFEFIRQGVPGFYQRQRADVFDLDVFADVRSKNQRYEISPYVIMNKLNWQLNGGITNADVFIDTTLIDKTLADIYLSNTRAEFRRNNYGFYQSFNWGNHYITKLSDTSYQQQFNSSVRLFHQMDYSQSLYTYLDDSTDFHFYYPHEYYFNPDSTSDSTYYSLLRNEISIEWNEVKHKDSAETTERKFPFNIFVIHDLHQLPFAQKKYINELNAGFECHSWLRPFYFYVSASAGKSEISDLNYRAEAYVTWYGSLSPWQFFLNVRTDNHPPSWFQNSYYSNHFNWNFNFKNEGETFAELGFYNSKNSAYGGIKYVVNENHIYFSANAQPAQHNGTLNGWVIYLKKNFRFGKIHVDNEIGINLVDENVFQLPVYAGKHLLYYENSLFKHALDFSSGIEVNYVSDYYAPSFNPATLTFYQQNLTLVHYYPVADFFVNMKIKSARIFLRIENLDQGLFEPGYFTVPSYPAADRSFKFGVSWMFWN